MPSKQIDVVGTRSTGAVMTSYAVQTCNQLVALTSSVRDYVHVSFDYLLRSFEDATQAHNARYVRISALLLNVQYLPVQAISLQLPYLGFNKCVY